MLETASKMSMLQQVQRFEKMKLKTSAIHDCLHLLSCRLCRSHTADFTASIIRHLHTLAEYMAATHNGDIRGSSGKDHRHP